MNTDLLINLLALAVSVVALSFEIYDRFRRRSDAPEADDLMNKKHPLNEYPLREELPDA